MSLGEPLPRTPPKMPESVPISGRPHGFVSTDGNGRWMYAPPLFPQVVPKPKLGAMSRNRKAREKSDRAVSRSNASAGFLSGHVRSPFARIDCSVSFVPSDLPAALTTSTTCAPIRSAVSGNFIEGGRRFVVVSPTADGVAARRTGRGLRFVPTANPLPASR